MHSESGQYRQAIQEYKAALAIRPDAAEAMNNLAVMFYQLHRYAEAFETAAKIWKAHPELKSASLIAGMAAVQMDHAKDAIEPLQSLLASDPSNRDAILALASAFFALHNFPKAIQLYEGEVSGSPQDSSAWYGLAICYERSAEESSARLALMPDGRRYSKLMLAHYLEGIGDRKLAAEAFGESQADPMPASSKAKQEYELARTLAANSKKAFEQLVALSTDSWQAAVFLGDVARQRGDLISAISHYNDGLLKEARNPGALLGLGTAYWEMGDFEKASVYLRQTLELNKNATQALFELGNIAIRQHNESKAIPLLKQYLSIQPDATAARADLGRAYFHIGQFENAVAELKKASANDERGDIHYQLSEALKKLGRDGEAEIAAEESAVLRKAQLQREQKLHAAQ